MNFITKLWLGWNMCDRWVIYSLYNKLLLHLSYFCVYCVGNAKALTFKYHTNLLLFSQPHLPPPCLGFAMFFSWCSKTIDIRSSWRPKFHLCSFSRFNNLLVAIMATATPLHALMPAFTKFLIEGQEKYGWGNPFGGEPENLEETRGLPAIAKSSNSTSEACKWGEKVPPSHNAFSSIDSRNQRRAQLNPREAKSRHSKEPKTPKIQSPTRCCNAFSSIDARKRRTQTLNHHQGISKTSLWVMWKMHGLQRVHAPFVDAQSFQASLWPWDKTWGSSSAGLGFLTSKVEVQSAYKTSVTVCEEAKMKACTKPWHRNKKVLNKENGRRTRA